MFQAFSFGYGSVAKTTRFGRPRLCARRSARSGDKVSGYEGSKTCIFRINRPLSSWNYQRTSPLTSSFYRPWDIREDCTTRGNCAVSRRSKIFLRKLHTIHTVLLQFAHNRRKSGCKSLTPTAGNILNIPWMAHAQSAAKCLPSRHWNAIKLFLHKQFLINRRSKSPHQAQLGYLQSSQYSFTIQSLALRTCELTR